MGQQTGAFPSFFIFVLSVFGNNVSVFRSDFLQESKKGIFVKNYSPEKSTQPASGSLFLFEGEFLFAHTAHRTLEIVREILKLCAGLDAAVRIAESLVVNISANITYIFCHVYSSIN